MIRRFNPRMDILPKAQKFLWPQLGGAQKLGFVLYGGTAIALRLGHRHSVDFDFFTDKALDKNALRLAFPFLEQATVLQETLDTYTLLFPYRSEEIEHVKVSFFGCIGFGRIGEPELTNDGMLLVASQDDLMATKLKVILQRIEAKDYIDIAAMIESGTRLDKGLAAARAMYGTSFQPSESLKAMVYFQGGDLHMLSSNVKKTLIKASSSVRTLPPIEQKSRVLAVQE